MTKWNPADMTGKPVRKLPIDWPAIVKESGLMRGKLCLTSFGWGVQNTHGDPMPHFCCITPPTMEPGETSLRIKGRDWCFYK